MKLIVEKKRIYSKNKIMIDLKSGNIYLISKIKEYIEVKLKNILKTFFEFKKHLNKQIF